MGKIKAVLFDFDGTLVDTNRLIIDSWQAVYRSLWGHEEDEKNILATFGEPLEFTIRRLFPDRPLQEILDTYRGYQSKVYRDRIEAFPGMVELVKELKERGYLLGVVTARLKESTLIGLDKFGIDKIIDAVVTCDDTDKHKPDPEPALLCLEKIGVEPQDAIMVGDSLLDIGCAKNAGMTAVLVQWTIALKDRLDSLEGNERPDYRMEKAEDLLDILKVVEGK